MIKKCSQCHKEYTKTPSEGNSAFSLRKFCSKKCCNDSRRGKKTGYKHPELWKKQMSEKRMGMVFTIEHKENLRKSHLGKKLSKESIQKRSILQSKENHYLWKGDDVGYAGIHVWINKWYGSPETCEHCQKTGLTGHSIHWANISGEYKREREDWKRLCAKCHRLYDMQNKLRHLSKNNRFNIKNHG